jgi:hypothetical protein
MNVNPQEQLIHDLEKVIGGKPIEDIAPLLIVAVARLLVIDAEGDTSKLAVLVSRFMNHLTATISGMIEANDEDTRH